MIDRIPLQRDMGFEFLIFFVLTHLMCFLPFLVLRPDVQSPHITGTHNETSLV